MAYPGRTLLATGIEVDDPDAFYLFETHMAIIWPIGPDGLFIGEDSYTGANGFDGIADRKIPAVGDPRVPAVGLRSQRSARATVRRAERSTASSTMRPVGVDPGPVARRRRRRRGAARGLARPRRRRRGEGVVDGADLVGVDGLAGAEPAAAQRRRSTRRGRRGRGPPPTPGRSAGPVRPPPTRPPRRGGRATARRRRADGLEAQVGGEVDLAHRQRHQPGRAGQVGELEHARRRTRRARRRGWCRARPTRRRPTPASPWAGTRRESPGWPTRAARSARPRSPWFTRTHTSGPAPASVAEWRRRRRRGPGPWPGTATASSRSRITASAPEASALAKRSGRSPGT